MNRNEIINIDYVIYRNEKVADVRWSRVAAEAQVAYFRSVDAANYIIKPMRSMA